MFDTEIAPPGHDPETFAVSGNTIWVHDANRSVVASYDLSTGKQTPMETSEIRGILDMAVVGNDIYVLDYEGAIEHFTLGAGKLTRQNSLSAPAGEVGSAENPV
ncbi:MAG: hypothetical protein LBR21_08275, partial [Propionibacteriaceae bacterium]|nr:hypothetical protein [Propionibacteriaceae bacterium]